MVFPIIWSGGILLGLILHKQEICGNVERSVTTTDTHSFYGLTGPEHYPLLVHCYNFIVVVMLYCTKMKSSVL